jgi:hypothetical protein
VRTAIIKFFIFPLTYFIIFRGPDLPLYVNCQLIEKSHGNILGISIWKGYNLIDPVYIKKLLNTIARNCPNIESLT